MVLTRLEAEAAQARNTARVETQQIATEAAATQKKDLEAAQELETRAMERFVARGEGGARRGSRL